MCVRERERGKEIGRTGPEWNRPNGRPMEETANAQSDPCVGK